MNPFEHGIVGAAGIHAVSDRSIAARGTRKVGGEDRRFFYNPMWSYFGDVSPGPPGTYFYDTGTQVNLYWNIFDQVLILAESKIPDMDLIRSLYSEDSPRFSLAPPGLPSRLK
ncbi:MAG: hypothetical protein ACYTBS_02275, partial [Planctomycetota bacterium]